MGERGEEALAALLLLLIGAGFLAALIWIGTLAIAAVRLALGAAS